MNTEVLKLDGSERDMGKIRHAAKLLGAGALVAFPTETVYGLGADANNPEALARMAEAKGRPSGKPFALLVPSIKEAEKTAGVLPRPAKKLMRLYWPGPLTTVVPRRGGGAVGLRLSEHPVPRALLAQCGFPIAAPSANRSGTREPLTSEQVLHDLGGRISLILDGGQAWHGTPSTVVRIDPQGIPAVQREGAIPQSEIMEAVRPTILLVCTGNTCRSPMAEALCRHALKESGMDQPNELPFQVLSAGTSATEGQSADPMAIKAMVELGIDLSSHRTRMVVPSLLDQADWIFTMTAAHRDSILKLMPECRDRIRLVSARGDEIPDPVTKSYEHYLQVRDRIAQCLRDILRIVKGSVS
ncbi:MAG: threonylcarbamoyl-AMP synthase [Planctomycetes bacterium]|nr:threonylcarbamoyl-AMP synthase [Planctomycetota bacterium]